MCSFRSVRGRKWRESWARCLVWKVRIKEREMGKRKRKGNGNGIGLFLVLFVSLYQCISLYLSIYLSTFIIIYLSIAIILSIYYSLSLSLSLSLYLPIFQYSRQLGGRYECLPFYSRPLHFPTNHRHFTNHPITQSPSRTLYISHVFTNRIHTRSTRFKRHFPATS